MNYDRHLFAMAFLLTACLPIESQALEVTVNTLCVQCTCIYNAFTITSIARALNCSKMHEYLQVFKDE